MGADADTLLLSKRHRRRAENPHFIDNWIANDTIDLTHNIAAGYGMN